MPNFMLQSKLDKVQMLVLIRKSWETETNPEQENPGFKCNQVIETLVPNNRLKADGSVGDEILPQKDPTNDEQFKTV